jgi:hypothetical protein
MFHAKRDSATNANAHLANLQAKPTADCFSLQKEPIFADAQINIEI